MERRLAAILAADVVGYSRLMGVDEAGTLAALKAHRVEIFDTKAAQYNGRTIKLMGDGALMEFASVVDAVGFAVEVQAAMAARNAGVAEDRRIVFGPHAATTPIDTIRLLTNNHLKGWHVSLVKEWDRC